MRASSGLGRTSTRQARGTVRRTGRPGVAPSTSFSFRTTMVPFTRHRAPIIRAYRPDLTPRAGPPIPSNIYGASCREDDVLFQGEMGRVVTGDYLVHFSVGAYNSSINPAFIFPCPILRFVERGSAVGLREESSAGGGF